MTILSSQTVLPEFIKLRWQEPYVSAGISRKTFKSLPRGVYNGFIVKPGPGLQEIQVVHNDPSGWDSTSGFSAGAFDTASGWSIAVHESVQGFNSTVAIQYAPGRNYVFDAAPYAGQSIYAVVDVQYQVGYATTAQVKLVNASELDSNPALIVFARVNVPMSGIVNVANIITDDPLYPRVLPFANTAKYGFMSKYQAQYLDFLQAVSGSPALNYETELPIDGPQDVDLPAGYTYVVGSDDLWVHANGRYLTKGPLRDYEEVDRGDGRGEKISIVAANVREGDRIKFRIQRYAAVATSTTRVLDEGSLIETNTIDFEFTGTGVAVFPNGPRRVKVVIPGGGGTGTKTHAVAQVGGIVNFRALHLRSDNAVVYYNPTDPTHKFYGIGIQNVAVSGFLDVQTAGIVAGAGPWVSGGAAVGDDVYAAQDGLGTLTVDYPDVLSGSVVRVGILAGADAVIGGSPVDIIFERARLS